MQIGREAAAEEGLSNCSETSTHDRVVTHGPMGRSVNAPLLKSLNNTELIATREAKYKSNIPKKIRRKLKKALRKRKRLE